MRRNDAALQATIAALPGPVRASVVRFGPGHDYGWHRNEVVEAMSALADVGAVILGLDFRSDGTGVTPVGMATEAPAGVDLGGPRTPADGLRLSMEALENAPWHSLDGYDWVLVTFRPRVGDVEWERVSVEIRENAEARRAALEPYGDFPALLEALLFEADPVGLNYETNTDEYRPEAQTIALRLPAASAAEDVLRIAHQEFVRWFGADTAGPMDRYADVAVAIWELWESNDWISM